MADSAGMTQAVDFTRKQSTHLTGKPSKVKSSMKRSQSQLDAKELSRNGFNSSLSVILKY